MKRFFSNTVFLLGFFVLSQLTWASNGIVKPNSRLQFEYIQSYLVKEFNLPESTQFVKINTSTDKLGYTHYTLQQYVNEVLVQDGITKVHVKEGEVVSITGNPITFNLVKSGSIGFKLVEDQIVASDLHKFEGKVIVVDNGSAVETIKVLVSEENPISRKHVYYSTVDGNVLREDDLIKHADATGTASTKYSGVQTIVTDSLDVDSFRLRDNGRSVETYNMQKAWFGNGVDFVDTDNNWNNVNVNQDEVATDAHWASEMYYDYLLNEHGRDSYDGAGDTLITKVHYGTNYGSAFWDGTSVTIGDGDGSTYGPLTTVDIIAHEFTHGLIEHTANLLSTNEPGALGESFGDIFATATEFYAKPGSANWTIKEDAHLSGGAARSLSNPNAYGQPDTYQGTNWNFNSGSAPIHINNGVQNFWFYLLVNGGIGVNDNSDAYSVSGIGMDDAMAIVYRVLTYYHTSTSTYTNARNYSIQAAEDLFGACTQQVISTINAWHAVGVGQAFNNSDPEAGFYADQVYSCFVPVTINFIDTSKNSVTYKWYFGDGDSSAVAFASHSYTSPGTYTVTQIVYGSSCSTPDTFELVDYITISASGGPSSTLCTPATTAYCCGRGISNVVFGSISNATGDGSASYQDYSCSESTIEVQGDNVPITVSTGLGSAEDVRVWIDFDNDGNFNNTNELVFISDNQLTTHSGSVYIDPTAVQNTPLRMRVVSDVATNNITAACNTVQYGQVEDYAITIIAPTGPPVVDFVGNPTNVVATSTVDFTNLTTNGATDFLWTFPGGTPSTSTALNPSIQYNTVGTYDVKLVASNSFGSDSTTKIGYINVGNEINLCTTTITDASSGTFYDSGGPSGVYQNNESCGLLIQPQCASSVEITFSFINFPSSADRLRIYDGTSNTDPLLATIGGPGQTIPAPISSANGYIYLEFTSDGGGQYDGWTGHWTSTPITAFPVASFNTSNNNPAFGTSVTFTDQTTNGPISWNWDFGDSNTSTDQNPQHSYSSPGSYTVTMIASNCVDADTAYDFITVQGIPDMSINLDSVYNITSECADTLRSQVVIYNNGSGDLELNYNTIIESICPEITVTINTVQWASEISWDLQDDLGNVIASGPAAGNQYADNSTYTYVFTACEGDYTFNSYDSFGDGWNGGTYEVTTSCDGSIIANNGGNVPAGNGQTESMSVTDCIGSCPKVYVEVITGTQWANEISWDLQDDQGTVVFTGGGPGNYANSTTYLDSIELCEGNYTFNAYDSFGDSWNGGVYNIYTSCDGSIIANNGGAVPDNGVAGGSGSQTESTENFFLSNCYNTAEWNSISSNGGIIAPTDSIVIDVEFYSEGLPSGIYYDTLTINSNDTATPLVLIPFIFELNNIEASIGLADTCLQFDSAQTGVTQNQSIWIHNNGCQDMTIGAVVIPNFSFALVSAPTSISGRDSAELIISFSPLGEGDHTGTVTVQSDGGDSTFCVTGYGLPSPYINFYPTNLSASVSDCEDLTNDSIGVYNTGNAELIFSSSWIGGNSWATASTYADTVAPGDTLWITIDFDATSESVGLLSDALLFASNDSMTPLQAYPVSLNVLGNPCVDFSYNYTLCSDSVAFTDFTTNNPTSWLWDFGDGTTSTDQNPVHVYDTVGIFNVLLITSNSVGIDSAEYSILVNYAAASFVLSGTYFSNDYIQVQSTSTGASTWSWNFGNGDVSVNPIDSSLYSSEASYIIQLVVSSDSGCIDTSVQQILIQDVSPIAGFTYIVTDSCGFTVAFEDTSTGGTVTAWNWDFGDGNSDTIANPNNTYDIAGSYTVILTVTNPFGSVTVSNLVEVELFEADFTVTGDLMVDSTLLFNSTPSNITGYTWNFGEGGFSTFDDPSYSYADTGTYTVTLIAISTADCQDIVTKEITISNVVSGIEQIGDNAGIFVFPNPNNGSFIISIEGDYTNAQLTLRNTIGQVVASEPLFATKHQIAFENWSSGVYFATITIDEVETTQKIIVK